MAPRALDTRLATRTWWLAALTGTLVSSAMALPGNLIPFVLAARSGGVTAPLHRGIPLMLLALLALGLAPGVGGWGPRDGAARGASTAAGRTTTRRTTTAVVYGELVPVSRHPGPRALLRACVGRVQQYRWAAAARQEAVHG